AVPKAKSSLPLIGAIVGVVLLVAAVAMYFILGGNPASTSASKSPRQPGAQSAPIQKQSTVAGLEMYTVDCAEGRAAVYDNGERVRYTPHRSPAKSGEQFEFVLKLEGYQDKSVQLTTTENKKTYTFMMDKKN